MSLSNRKSQYKGVIAENIAIDLRHKDVLKRMSERPRPTKKEIQEKDIMISKGMEFSENGIPFDMIPEELANHHFFKIGYNIGERKKIVNHLQAERRK